MAQAARNTVLSFVSVIFRVSVGILALIVALALAFFLFASKAEPERKVATEPGLLVRSLQVARVDLAREWEGYGTVRPMRAADVRAQVAGPVLERPTGVEAGRPIAKGATIVRIDPEEFEARVKAAQGLVDATRAQLERLAVEEANAEKRVDLVRQELELTRAEYRRLSDAFERGAGNRNEVENRLAQLRALERTAIVVGETLDLIPTRRAELESQLANQQASLRLAQIDLERTNVEAPFDALLQEVDVRAGDRVNVGERVARVVDLSRVEAPIRLPASAASSVRVGDPVEITTDSPDPVRWEGAVAGLAPEADAGTRSITALVEVEQDPAGAALLRPGQFVVARVTSGSPTPRLVVPRSAVADDHVYIAELAGEVERVDLRRVGVSFYFDGALPSVDPDESQWAVLDEDRSRIGEGETLVTSNLDELRDGSAVRTSQVDAIARDGNVNTPATAREGGS